MSFKEIILGLILGFVPALLIGVIVQVITSKTSYGDNTFFVLLVLFTLYFSQRDIKNIIYAILPPIRKTKLNETIQEIKTINNDLKNRNVPQKYLNEDIIAVFMSHLINGRAYSLFECIDLYEKHKKKVSATQIAIAKQLRKNQERTKNETEDITPTA